MTKNIDNKVDTNTNRRTFLAGVGAIGTALLTGTAAASDGEQPAGGDGDEPYPRGGGPEPGKVDTREEALAWMEEQMQNYTNRPANSYLDGADGVPQLAYDTSNVTRLAINKQIRHAAMAWAGAINMDAPLHHGIQFRVYHAEVGQPYEYVASYHLSRELALDYTGGAVYRGTIARDEYLRRAISQFRWR